jgi:hypothetical protein
MRKAIDKFVKGTRYLKVDKAVSGNELARVLDKNEALLDKKIVKFIPASGAATRMFQNLYLFLDNHEETEFMKHFFTHLSEFPFCEELGLNQLKDKTAIVKGILDEYGVKPKALIKIHKYGLETVTPIEEHINESLLLTDKENLSIHFTISNNHEQWVRDYVEKVNKEKVQINYSFQEKSTDTLAVDLDNNPFYLENGDVLYRAGGHGALIYNLNQIDSDIIIIKNIDNVSHRLYVKDTTDSRIDLITIGLNAQRKIFSFIQDLNSNSFDLKKINDFFISTLNITIKEPLTKDLALSFLQRPLRVCGVVKNEGEPGGGPFIIDNGDYLDPQIVEMKELDIKKDKELIAHASYFNPVDLICFVKDNRNRKYNLLDFINEDRYFISEKSYKGRTLKALEHPGLWNGAMHNWNTVFVEVPLTTFNPIKTVNDLLRKGHLGK